jgi:hypothetical protein
MKPVLFLAFLALGPALAVLIPVARPAVDPATAAALNEQAPYPASALPDSERVWLCGR